MFAPVFDSLKKVTETTLKMQQEMYEKWVSLWPGVKPAQAAFAEPAQKFQKKWAEFYEETLKKQRDTLEAQFKAGLKNIEDAFRLAEAKDSEELRARTSELWQKVFETLRQSYEAQLREPAARFVPGRRQRQSAHPHRDPSAPVPARPPTNRQPGQSVRELLLPPVGRPRCHRLEERTGDPWPQQPCFPGGREQLQPTIARSRSYRTAPLSTRRWPAPPSRRPGRASARR